ncbi:MAG: hypothetical protein KAQ93_09085, partial [Spirochaetales bacterium]|nr:hypothetical protein [Spirochaetales bacterium]
MSKKIFFLMILSAILINFISGFGMTENKIDQESDNKEVVMTGNNGNLETATLGGGCFWCM